MKHKEKILSNKREYRIKNKETIQRNSKDYYLRNKEKKQEKSREYYEKNRERKRDYRTKFKLRLKQKKSEYYFKNKEKTRQKAIQKRKEKNPNYSPIKKPNFWKEFESVRTFLDSISKRLHILQLSDWYRISKSQIMLVGGISYFILL